MTKPLYK